MKLVRNEAIVRVPLISELQFFDSWLLKNNFLNEAEKRSQAISAISGILHNSTQPCIVISLDNLVVCRGDFTALRIAFMHAAQRYITNLTTVHHTDTHKSSTFDSKFINFCGFCFVVDPPLFHLLWPI